MDASRGPSATPAALPENPDAEGLQIWIPLPLAALAVLLGVVACLLVLGPVTAGSIVALGFFTLLPGLAVVRLVGLHDPVLEVVLGIALSFAIAGLVSVVQAYFGGWSPSITLAALVATTVVAVLAPRVSSLARRRSRPASVPAASAVESPVAWPTATPRLGGAPLYVRPQSVHAELGGATGSGATAAPAAQVAPAASAAPVPSVASVSPAVKGVPVLPAPPVTPVAPVAPAASVAPVDPVAPAARPARGTRRAAPDPAPAAGSRPNRATRSAIDHLVDNLSEQRDRTQS